ncbi:hypothetical protein D910_05942 [Dendroctonus ponderosae]|uniref:Uncharacterized protein n=1 Tax=Dendroctonus ponderosae TaxID=77166 RepID=U4U654_DENPD|nr:hypothetical protein D910_05942 [Dendroctonus ponderosae]
MPSIDFNAWKESAQGQGGCIIRGRHVQIGESTFPSPCTSCICTAEGGGVMTTPLKTEYLLHDPL